ncbi:MAG: UDP-N-acetylmuramoyl-L-alanine--D-glutamate ligase [Phycisphaerae bacterium]
MHASSRIAPGCAHRAASRPPRVSFAGKRVLVIGLGHFGGGVGVTRWLASQGAIISVTDTAGPDRLRESINALTGLPVRFQLGGHDDVDLDSVDLAVVNPAIPKSGHRLFAEINSRSISWTTEINLFCERCPAPIVAVTGSFGKSTTSAMLATILERTGAHQVFLGGNIGRSLLPELDRIKESDVVVLELSDAQLEDVPHISWTPQVAIITNLHPHHLDRYASFAAYVETKLHILGNGAPPQCVIAGEMDTPAAAMLRDRAARQGLSVVPVSEAESPIKLSVPGEHNQRNARCALTAARAMGIADSEAQDALNAFPGLPHRLEVVRELGGVQFVNDSKATAPSATVAAVTSFDRPVVVLVGGQQVRDADFGEFARVLAARCRLVVGMGESGERMVGAVRAAIPADRHVGLSVRDSLEEVCALAMSKANAGDVVLFSPGAPSYDAYANYCRRGEHFGAVVRGLTADRL